MTLKTTETNLPKVVFNSVEELKTALIAAKDAHSKYEVRLGKKDFDWPGWYAQFMSVGHKEC